MKVSQMKLAQRYARLLRIRDDAERNGDSSENVIHVIEGMQTTIGILLTIEEEDQFYEVVRSLLDKNDPCLHC